MTNRVSRSRTVGILGGMGPLATADLYRKIILATPATCDQEHLHVIIDADPTVPDRTAALRGDAPDPLPWLERGARLLETAGADFIVIPCNTAHAWLPRLRPLIGIPILDMIAETAARVRADYPAARRAGLLATRGTIGSALYHQALAAHGLTTLTPALDGEQQLVDRAIAAVKAGDTGSAASDPLVAAARALAGAGADVLLAACTEIPLALTAAQSPVPLLDPTQVLAEAAVREGRSQNYAEAGTTSENDDTTAS
jgi:aspartate racemase